MTHSIRLLRKSCQSGVNTFTPQSMGSCGSSSASSQQTTPAASQRWLPLESNPELLNEVGAKWGLPSTHGFVEVLGMDPELLKLVPRPVAACVFLFPCTEKIHAFRKRLMSELSAKGRLSHDEESKRGIFFMRQHREFGNACGTIAAIHAITNGVRADLDGDSPLGSFASDNAGRSADDVGSALLAADGLKTASDSDASSGTAQTACPARDAPPLEHHFVTFCRSAGGDVLLELDGTKPCPIDHGKTSATTFLEDAARVVQRCFMEVEPDSIEFSMLALVRRTE